MAEGGGFFAEFLDDYYAESEDHLVVVRRSLLALEGAIGQPQVDRALLDDLFRSVHSLKGLSGMVGVSAAERLAHHMESYLRALRQGQVVLTAEAFDALLDGAQLVEQVIASQRAHEPAPDIEPVVDQLAAATPGEMPAGTAAQPAAAPAPVAASILGALTEDEGRRIAAGEQHGARAWHLEFTPSPVLAERGVNVNTIRARLQEAGELIRAVPQVTPHGGIVFEFLLLTQAAPAVFEGWREDGLVFAPYARLASGAEPQPAPAPDGGLSGPVPAPGPAAMAPPVAYLPHMSVVRVDLARLDGLMQMTGQVVVSRARLEDGLARVERLLPGAEWQTLQEASGVLERQLRDLREGVMRLRLVPIGEVFERMQFVVRDLARDSGKRVTLELAGQQTEIDKFVVERMADPLMHLVRNAVSHGLEVPAGRVAQGKPPEGRISLRAATAGDQVVVEIADDGRGIDREAVAERARGVGLISGDGAIDDRALLNILCTPGFSTRDAADRASGRGVGMAVVSRAVHELGGSLALETEPGRGTRFTVHLPLTLAIVDALIVGVAGQRFAVPIPSVREIVEVRPADVTALENNEIITYRGRVLPLVRLARVFNLEGEPDSPSEKLQAFGKVGGPLGEERGFYALVVGADRDPAAIAVDRVLGQREIVVRALADPLVQVPGLAGATELGDGRLALILDTTALRRARLRGADDV